MRSEEITISIKIDVQNPIEINDFVNSFAGIASQYQNYVKNDHNASDDEAKIFIKEFRKGSIIATLVPAVVPIIAGIDHILVCKDFVKVMGGTISALSNGVTKGIPKSDLKDFHKTVAMIANDPDGSIEMEAASFTQTEKRTHSSFVFKTKDAKKIQKVIDVEFSEVEAVDIEPERRVLMMFTRSDKNKAKLNTSSGERVLIEELSSKSLALMYTSEVAEERIKHEIRESEDNVYKKGFIVDVMVKTRGNKPVAYSVTDCHDIIDLPDEEE